MKKFNVIKRVFATLLAVAMILTALPVMSFAVTDYTLTFKVVGDEVTVVDCKAGTTDLEIVVPETYNGKPVTVIGDGAFSNIPFVWDGDEQFTRKVTLPKTVKKIGFMAFGLTAIDEININELENLEYIGAYAFMDSFISGDIVLPDTVTYVGASAFTSTAITSIHLGKNVNIPQAEKSSDVLKCILRDNGSILSLLSSNIMFGTCCMKSTETEKSIALCCPNLKKITVDLRNPNYRSVNGVLYSKDMTKLYTYPSGKTDALYKMPATVDAFYNAFGGYYIQPVQIGVYGVAYDLMESSSITPTSAIGKKKQESDTTGIYYITKFASNLKTVVLSERVTEISDIAFYNTGLQRIYITKNVNTIGEKAFWHCTDLETVGFARDSVFTKLPKECFKDCTSLKNVTFGVTNYLDALSFGDCSSLESIDLTNVKGVSSTAFDGCTSLSEVIYQDTDSENKVTVSAQSFDNQSALQTVMLGNSVESVKSKAFANCANLTTAYISDEIESIDATAFNGCPNLTIVCPSEECYAYEFATAQNIPVTTLQIMPIPNQVYTGEEITPDLTVKASGNTLEKHRDYNAYFKDNIDVGTASATVLGEGNYNIFAAQCKFAIVQRDLNDGAEIGEIPTQVYTGDSITPEIEVTFGGRTLEKDVDYILEYADNTEVGTAIVGIIGINNFTGVCTAEFDISEELVIATGDFDGNGVLDSSDYSVISSYVLGLTNLTKVQRAFADINKDGAIDAFGVIALDLMVHKSK